MTIVRGSETCRSVSTRVERALRAAVNESADPVEPSHPAAIPARAPAEAPGPWSPLAISLFRWIWIATVVSYIGTWFQEVAAGWVMTTLSASPLMVSLVQVATTVPLLLLGLPAGTLADIVDRRRLLIGVTVWMMVIAGLLATVALSGRLTSELLLVLVFAGSLGSAFSAPAWQSIVPELVPRNQLSAAIALNSVGTNIARALGPALAGVIIASVGPGFAFAVNALSFVGVLLVLVRWQRSPRSSDLPPEQLVGGTVTGIRYVRHAPEFVAVLVRSGLFSFFAAALWALLPLVSRKLLDADATGYGVLLGTIGVGAVSGALVLPALRYRLGPGRLVVLASLIYASALAGLAAAPAFVAALGLMLLAGFGWIAVLSTLNASAQFLLPAWVRARGLSISLTVFFGGMAIGSITWGSLASIFGLPAALLGAATGLMLGQLAALRFRLPVGSGPDFSPSKHWPIPAIPHDPRNDPGPVMVTVEYVIDPSTRREFLQAARALRRLRLRDGALSWELYAEPEREGVYIEVFTNRSWNDHLRMHDRFPEADRELEGAIRRFHVGDQPPKVAHLLSTRGERIEA